MGWLVWCILILIFLGLLTSWWYVLILILVSFIVAIFTICFSDTHAGSRRRGPKNRSNSSDEIAAYDDFIASMDDE